MFIKMNHSVFDGSAYKTLPLIMNVALISYYRPYESDSTAIVLRGGEHIVVKHPFEEIEKALLGLKFRAIDLTGGTP